MIETTTTTLTTALDVIRSVVEARNTMPILANVLIKPTEHGIQLTGSDLQTQANVACEVAGNTPAFTVNAQKLGSICKSLPKDCDVSLESDVDKNVLAISSGKSLFQLATLPQEDFPCSTTDTTNLGTFMISGSVLRKMLTTVLPMVAKNDPRHYLNGLMLEVNKDQLRAVGTDGHRLALCEYNGPMDGSGTQLILPRKYATILAKHIPNTDEQIRVEYSTRHCSVQLGIITLQSQLIEGKFPEYQRVIPKDLDKIALVDRQHFHDAIVRTLVFKEQKYLGVKLMFTNNVLEISVSKEGEQFNDSIDIEYQGPEVAIGFDAWYLLDALHAIASEKVMLEFTDALTSMIFRDPENASDFIVQMPMRL